MKKATLIVFCIFGIQSIYAQNEPQKTVRQLENGVIIVQSAGVPSQNQAVFTPNPDRSIDNWNLSECEDALRHIKLKLEETSPEAENYPSILANYKEEQAKIERRKEVLIKESSK